MPNGRVIKYHLNIGQPNHLNIGQPDHLNTGQIDAILFFYVLVQYLNGLASK